jgi:hypothetical protein
MSDAILEAAGTLLKTLKDTNAGQLKIVLNDNEDQPLRAVIALSEPGLIKKVVEVCEEWEKGNG